MLTPGMRTCCHSTLPPSCTVKPPPPSGRPARVHGNADFKKLQKSPATQNPPACLGPIRPSINETGSSKGPPRNAGFSRSLPPFSSNCTLNSAGAGESGSLKNVLFFMLGNCTETPAGPTASLTESARMGERAGKAGEGTSDAHAAAPL